MRLAESFLASGHTASDGGDSHVVTVHVDAEVLTAGGNGRCKLEDRAAIVAEVVCRPL